MSSELRIAFVTHEYPPHVDGGAGTYASELSVALARNGHHVDVFTPAAGLCPFGVRVVSVLRHGRSALSFWRHLPRVLRESERKYGRYDVIHGNGIADLSLSRRHACRGRIVTVHHLAQALTPTGFTGLPSRLKDVRGETGLVPLVEGHILRRSDHVIAVSNQTRNEVIEFGIRPERVSTIHNGLRMPPAQDLERLRSFRERLCGPDDLMLACLGRLEHRKGTDILLKAFQKLQRRHPRTRLFFVGEAKDPKYTHMVRDLEIADRVTFLGRLDDPTRDLLLAACDIGVVPSRLEGFGFATVELMAAGKPIVTTRTGIAADGLITRAHGEVTDANEEALFRALDLLMLDRERLSTVGEYNRSWVRETFSWTNAAAQTVCAYNRAITEGPRDIRGERALLQS